MLQELTPGKDPGQWQRFLADKFGDAPRWGVLIKCPECARWLSCSNHTIADNGQMSPSVGHPTSYPPCAWHTSPRLLGWEVLPPPAPREICVCESCGARSRDLGGWGTWSGGAGLICPTCFAARKPEAK